jgi:hypothetical protein
MSAFGSVLLRIANIENLLAWRCFWSQSPWSLKPIPVVERTPEENKTAITKHFAKQKSSYFGRVIVVNLAEQSGKEGLLVKEYEEKVNELKDENVV